MRGEGEDRYGEGKDGGNEDKRERGRVSRGEYDAFIEKLIILFRGSFLSH